MPLATLKPRITQTIGPLTAKVLRSDSWHGGLKTTSSERGYGHAWRKARKRFLHEHPLCVYCQRKGRVTAATVVDHIAPHRGDRSLFWDESNWQSLCTPCHSSTKQREEIAGETAGTSPGS